MANEAIGSPPSSAGGTPGTLLGVAGLGDGTACLSESRGMELRPLALYLMLDSSGSMEEPAGESGATKWQAIQRAIRGFLTETRDTDLFLGLQFFPLLKPGASFNCTSHEDCGPEGGPCFLSTCLMGSSITLCRTDADCGSMPNVNPCVDFGLCANSDPLAPLACVLGNPCESGLGNCQEFERSCTNATACDPARYGTPAVEIGPLSSTYAEIDQALAMQLPQGLTPTVPALQGALEHARGWAGAHPERTVATLLATDGLPTDCAAQPVGIPSQPAMANPQPPGASASAFNQVLDIASAGAAGSLPIRTFVIGVFQPGDSASIDNVNAIARAGGTEKAAFIDTSGEVEAQFLTALRTVRDAAATCRLPLQSTEGVDFTRADLVFDAGNGTATPLPYVEGLLGCATSPQGWFYDTAPALGRPQALELCPSVCQLVKTAPAASLELELGCASE